MSTVTPSFALPGRVDTTASIWPKLFLGAVAALVIVSLIWVFVEPGSHVRNVLLWVAVTLLGVALVLPLAGRTVRTMARHTFTECLRTKVAAVFIVLLAVTLAVLPKIMKGDGTLAGQVQTFLDYSTSLTALLLSLATIFLSASVIATDVRTRRVFSVATKPVSRWQYVVGRWMGLTLLNAMLLLIASGVIYGLAQYLRGGNVLNAEDRRKLDREIFTAREQVAPVPLDVSGDVKKRLDQLRQDARSFEDTLNAVAKKDGLTRQEALAVLTAQIESEERSKRQVIAINQSRSWRFEGVRLSGEQIRGRGEVLVVDTEQRAFRIRTDESVMGYVVYRGPVKVNAVEGYVIRRAAKAGLFEVVFPVEAMLQPGVGSLKAGQEVWITVEPMIQLRYKPKALGEAPENALLCTWQLTNEKTGNMYSHRRTDPPGQTWTVSAPEWVVDADGKTTARYFNELNPRTQTGTNVKILEEDVRLLYRVGGFEWNFVRGMALILLQLMFIAAVGVFAASFASFPVACIVCFHLLPFSVARQFLQEAVKLPHTVGGAWEAAWYEIMGHYVFRMMVMVLPDFALTSPGDRLVDGMYISWADLGAAGVLTLAIRAVLALALACLIFHKRELAHVQV